MDVQVCSERSQREREARIQELEQEIADLKARWPKHSVAPAMFMRLEELEEELEQLLRRFDPSTLRLGSGQAGLRASSAQDK
jgi:uncharacterized protein YceH (UPF0502 family)